MFVPGTVLGTNRLFFYRSNISLNLFVIVFDVCHIIIGVARYSVLFVASGGNLKMSLPSITWEIMLFSTQQTKVIMNKQVCSHFVLVAALNI